MNRASRLAVFAAIAVVSFALVALAATRLTGRVAIPPAAIASSLPELVAAPTSTTCVLGVTGVNATIEARGITADDYCSFYDGTEIYGGRWYRYEAGHRPQGEIVCSGRLISSGDPAGDHPNALHLIVRDQGTFMLYGSRWCNDFPGEGFVPD
jgi:hypothetical protein